MAIHLQIMSATLYSSSLVIMLRAVAAAAAAAAGSIFSFV
jgi:hypothetical protein